MPPPVSRFGNSYGDTPQHARKSFNDSKPASTNGEKIFEEPLTHVQRPPTRRELKLKAQLEEAAALEAKGGKPALDNDHVTTDEQLAAALTTSGAAPKQATNKPRSNAKKPEPVVDLDYAGRGHPFDRLQFGYSPSDLDEAKAFHGNFTVQQWKVERSTNYRKAIIKQQKLVKLNCEPLVSMFKLKRHWAALTAAKRKAEGRGYNNDISSNVFDGTLGDDLIEHLTSKQTRVDESLLESATI